MRALLLGIQTLRSARAVEWERLFSGATPGATALIRADTGRSP